MADSHRGWSTARSAAGLLLSILVAAPGTSASAGPKDGDLRVVIVTPDESDSRLPAAREAIGFWNQTLSELGRRPRLVEQRLLVAPPITRSLEGYTRQIWLLAGRPVPTGGGPPPPRDLMDLDADVVLFFSSQVIFSFAWPSPDRTRYFIGIQTDHASPFTSPNVARNVIAHELGHVLGLTHNGNTATLMCGPCENLVYSSEQPVFFPLTAEERARLLVLQPAQ